MEKKGKMIPDADTIQVEVMISGKVREKYISHCIEGFRADEIPCSYACKGEYPGKIRQIQQIRARNAATWEEVPVDSGLWKTIQYGARHKLGHGKGLCKECKKLGIRPDSPTSPPRHPRGETPP